MTGRRDGERERVGTVYAAYAASARRRRAWSLGNAGARAVRHELAERLARAAAPALAGSGPLLDVGCGSGWWLDELAARAGDPARVHGVDLLEPRVAAATRRVPGASVAHGDALALPFPDATFSLVSFVVVLSSLDGPGSVARALAEGARVLAPGGRVVVYEPRWPNPLNRHTRLVRVAALDEVLGAPVHRETLTVLPPLARRLGRLAGPLYPRLAAVRPLLTHRISVHRPAG